MRGSRLPKLGNTTSRAGPGEAFCLIINLADVAIGFHETHYHIFIVLSALSMIPCETLPEQDRPIQHMLCVPGADHGVVRGGVVVGVAVVGCYSVDNDRSDQSPKCTLNSVSKIMFLAKTGGIIDFQTPYSMLSEPQITKPVIETRRSRRA